MASHPAKSLEIRSLYYFWRHSFLLTWLAVFVLTACLLPRSGWARRNQENQRLDKQATQLLQAGKAALATHSFAAAYRALLASYRLQPSPRVLYELGILALAQGRILEAQDLLRRYLADPETDAAAEPLAQQEAQRIVALARPASGKLSVLGERGTLVFVEDQLVGSLPLSRPLLLSAGEHKLTMERAGRRQEDTVQVPVGRFAELRATSTSDALLLTILPGVLVLDSYVGVAPEAQRLLAQAIEEGVQSEHLSSILPNSTLIAQRASCLNTPRCQTELAQKTAADFVLTVQVQGSGGPGGFRFRLILLDAGVEGFAAGAAPSCTTCSSTEAATVLTAAVSSLLSRGQRRPRGTLEVSSTPPGAEVRSKDQLLGRTPYKHLAWAGEYKLTIGKDDYHSQRRIVNVLDNQVVRLSVTLDPDNPEPAPAPLVTTSAPAACQQRQQRPRWRLVLGSVALGAGVLLLSSGVAALTIADRCMTDTGPMALGCASHSALNGSGVGLAVSGTIVSGAGALLLGVTDAQPREAALQTRNRVSGAASGLFIDSR